MYPKRFSIDARIDENQKVTGFYFRDFEEENFPVKIGKPFSLIAADKTKATALLREQTRQYLATLKKYPCGPYGELPILF
jgi:hypothetical protein